MTLNGIMAVILRYSAEFGSFRGHYVKVVEDRPVYCLRQKCSPKNLVLAIMAKFVKVSGNEFVEAPPVKSDNLINTWQTARDRM